MQTGRLYGGREGRIVHYMNSSSSFKFEYLELLEFWSDRSFLQIAKDLTIFRGCFQ